MAIARTDVALSKPSEEIRLAQDVVRSILVKDDLLEDPLLLEGVAERLGEIEMEMGELAGKQQMFELLMK